MKLARQTLRQMIDKLIIKKKQVLYMILNLLHLDYL